MVKLNMKANFSFFAFWLPSALAEVCEPRSAREDAPQVLANEAKSARGNKPKGMQKSGRKFAFIPYFNNIEITSIDFFVEMPEKSLFFAFFMYNRLLSVISSILSYDRILIGIKKESLGELSLNTITGRSL